MRKEYRDVIIGGIASGIGGTIIFYLIRGEVPWAYLFTYPIFFAIAHFFFNKKREAKKEESAEEVKASTCS